MKALRFGYIKFDSDTCQNKKEAAPISRTASSPLLNFTYFSGIRALNPKLRVLPTLSLL
jgi:hypothetical protein